MSIVYLIAPDCRVTVWRDPHSSKIVRMYFVIYKLAQTGLVYVYAASLSMVNLTVDYGGVGAGLYFKTSNSIVVDIISFKITL